MAETQTYDAVVIGGGPAGAAAAYTLASSGINVCLIDKANFPRDKLCGGGMTFRSKRAFERIFKRPWDPALINASRNIAFYARGRFVAAYKSNTPIHFMMRRGFDHYLVTLAQQAGATLRQGDAVTAIDPAGQRVTLRSGADIGFRFLVAADGVNSLVAKTLFGRAFNPRTIAFALEAEVPRAQLPQQGDIVELDLCAARWGYGWVFPKQDCITIGVGGMHRRNPDLRAHLDRYFKYKGLDTRGFKVKGQYLPSGETLAVPGRGNILLAGDAAGAVDPVSGEGIPYALLTGEAAGRAVAAAISTNADALALYTADYGKIVAPFARARLWRRLVYPWPMQRLLGWLLRYPRLLRWLVTGA